MSSIDRRDFLKLVGAGAVGAAGGFAIKESARHPVEQYVPYVETPEDYVPGVATWYNTVCGQCAAGCGIRVRVREGRAKKIEGNPLHPVSQGRLCALGEAGLNVLYNPDRVRTPLQRSGDRGSGQFSAIDWERGFYTVAERLGNLVRRDGDGKIAFLTGGATGHLDELFARFVGAFDSDGYLHYDFMRPDNLVRANELTFGQSVLPYYDIENAGMLLSFGADFAGTWLSPVHHSLGYGRMRQGGNRRGTFVHVEPRMSLTAASADRWLAAKPGTEGLLALGLANRLVTGGHYTGADRSRWASSLAEFTSERVATATGLAPAVIDQLGETFATKRPALAIAGGAMAAATNAVPALVAVNALNHLAGAVGRPGGILFNPDPAIPPTGAGPSSAFAAIESLIERIEAGNVDVLVVHDANPLFTVPASVGLADALAKVPFIVALGTFIDETAAMADIVLPTHSYLEAWGDSAPDPGVGLKAAALRQPVVAPVFDSRGAGDIVIELARRIGGEPATALPWTDTEAFLRTQWQAIYRDRSAALDARDFDGFWRAVLSSGVWAEQVTAAQTAGDGAIGDLTVAIDDEAPKFAGDASSFPFVLQPYPSVGLRDGRGANLPWMQELPDPMTSIVYSSWVEIHPVTADELDLKDGDIVAVRSEAGTIEAPVHRFAGIAPGVVAMPIGQGHTRFGRYASGRGANPLEIVVPQVDPRTRALAWAATRVSIEKTGKRHRYASTSGVSRTLGRQILGPSHGDGGH